MDSNASRVMASCLSRWCVAASRYTFTWRSALMLSTLLLPPRGRPSGTPLRESFFFLRLRRFVAIHPLTFLQCLRVCCRLCCVAEQCTHRITSIGGFERSWCVILQQWP